MYEIESIFLNHPVYKVTFTLEQAMKAEGVVEL